MGDTNHNRGNKLQITLFIPLFTPFPGPTLGQRQMARERPYPEKEKAALSIPATPSQLFPMPCRCPPPHSDSPPSPAKASFSDPAAAPCCTSPAPCCFPRGQAAAQSHQPISVLIGPGRKGRPPAMRRRAPAQVHVAHRVGEPIGRSEALSASVRKQIAATARDALQVFQHRYGLRGQRADIVTPRFHLRRRPTPRLNTSTPNATPEFSRPR